MAGCRLGRMLTAGPGRLSVLDLAPVSAGSTVAEALRNSLDMEPLGYLRHWVAEHHGIASSAPAVLIAHLASVRARCGSARAA